MTKVMKRKPLPNDDPEVSRSIGDFYEWELGKDQPDTAKGYTRASYEHMAAAGEYAHAKDRARLLREKEKFGKLEHHALEQAQKAQAKAALYQATEHYFAPIRWILRQIGWSKIFGFFIFAFLLSDAEITGSVIGNSGEINSILGISLFFLGIAGCYLLFWKNHLINRYRDKY